MKILTTGTALLMVLMNCSMTRQNEAENLTCEQAYDLIQKHLNDSNFVILDLRTETMFTGGHIENSIYYDVFSDNFDDWAGKLDRNKVYLLYCNVGHRSGIALEKMKELGFKSLYHMYEGIREWEKQGYPVIKTSIPTG